jgi:hypothetical protein
LVKNSSTDYDVAWKTAGTQQAIVSIPTGSATGRVTWTFPIPYAAGIVPIIQALPVKPTNVTNASYNVQLYGDPTNTSVTIEANAIASTQNVVLGVNLAVYTPVPVGTKVHIVAFLP